MKVEKIFPISQMRCWHNNLSFFHHHISSLKSDKSFWVWFSKWKLKRFFRFHLYNIDITIYDLAINIYTNWYLINLFGFALQNQSWKYFWSSDFRDYFHTSICIMINVYIPTWSSTYKKMVTLKFAINYSWRRGLPALKSLELWGLRPLCLVLNHCTYCVLCPIYRML